MLFHTIQSPQSSFLMWKFVSKEPIFNLIDFNQKHFCLLISNEFSSCKSHTKGAKNCQYFCAEFNSISFHVLIKNLAKQNQIVFLNLFFHTLLLNVYFQNVVGLFDKI